ncbi:MAG: YhfC family glutamic-type intramembrane protease [Desulfurococcaceae archaeon]
MLVLVFPILGGLLGLGFLRLIGFKRFSGGDIILGLVVFFLSIIIQQPIQQMPILYIGFITSSLGELMTSGNVTIFQRRIIDYLYSHGLLYVLIISTWFGYIAGFIQTAFKYLFIRDKSYTASVNIGAGFGLVEAFYIGITGFISTIFTGYTVIAPIYYYALSALERFSTFLFHVGSALYLYNSWIRKNRKGALVIIGIHGFIDTLATLYQFTADKALLIVIEALVLVTGLTLILKLYKSAIIEAEEKVMW